METLEIKNFLVIDYAKIEMKRFNILIGPQASGKSVIAKLFYFFRKFVRSSLFPVTVTPYVNFLAEKSIENLNLSEFEQFFPRYTWEKQPFSISYKRDDIEISLIFSKEDKSSLKITYSDNFYSKYREELERELFDFMRNKNITNPFGSTINDIFQRRILMEDGIYGSSVGKYCYQSKYLPAGRSYFAILKEKIFSFLFEKVEIDPFLISFGSDYELVRNRIGTFVEKEKKLTQQILKGKYLYEKGEDWIIARERRTNLIHASSGQQESLPLLLIVSAWSNLEEFITFFIEEPESHLFPTSQRYIISLFSLAYNKGHHFFITTHSPYILVAINNLIMASNLVKERGESVLNDLAKLVSKDNIIDKDYLIDFDDVSAYTVEGGTVKSLLDNESKLIVASAIDSVSDDFDSVFDAMINLKMQDD